MKRKRNRKETESTRNGNKYRCINNYLKCQWTESSNQKIQRWKKWYKDEDWMKKRENNQYNMLSIRDGPQGKDTHRLEVRGWKINISCK